MLYTTQYDEGDMYEHFRSFYEDVFPEFTSVGKVVQFKVWCVCVCVCGYLLMIFTIPKSQVACNYEPHLRGNVYVQYQR